MKSRPKVEPNVQIHSNNVRDNITRMWWLSLLYKVQKWVATLFPASSFPQKWTQLNIPTVFKHQCLLLFYVFFSWPDGIRLEANTVNWSMNGSLELIFELCRQSNDLSAFGLNWHRWRCELCHCVVGLWFIALCGVQRWISTFCCFHVNSTTQA